MHGVAAYGVVKASALLAIELLRIPDENHPNAGFSFHLVTEEAGRSMCASARTRWFYQRHGPVGFNECLSPQLPHAASAKLWVCAGAHL